MKDILNRKKLSGFEAFSVVALWDMANRKLRILPPDRLSWKEKSAETESKDEVLHSGLVEKLKTGGIARFGVHTALYRCAFLFCIG